jgi:hypothetical protein
MPARPRSVKYRDDYENFVISARRRYKFSSRIFWRASKNKVQKFSLSVFDPVSNLKPAAQDGNEGGVNNL